MSGQISAPDFYLTVASPHLANMHMHLMLGAPVGGAALGVVQCLASTERGL